VSRILVLVEGQTEEVFVNQVVGPALAKGGVYLVPKVLTTKVVKSGRQFRGGVSKFTPLRRDLQRLLRDTGAACVTTMLDYYGLPADFPGLDTLPARPALQRAEHLEASLEEAIGDPRLIAYLSVHEFEALILAGLDELATTLQESPDGPRIQQLRQLLAGGRSPEEVNDGETTHPSYRIQAAFPRYQKTLHGRLISARIGLPRLRQACPHFGAWIDRLEGLGE
jgi:hypothetical protein